MDGYETCMHSQFHCKTTSGLIYSVINLNILYYIVYLAWCCVIVMLRVSHCIVLLSGFTVTVEPEKNIFYTLFDGKLTENIICSSDCGDQSICTYAWLNKSSKAKECMGTVLIIDKPVTRNTTFQCFVESKNDITQYNFSRDIHIVIQGNNTKFPDLMILNTINSAMNVTN